MKCCGRTFKDQAALKAHQGSNLHSERSAKGGTQPSRKSPQGAQSMGRARSSKEMVKMSINVGPMLAGIPFEAQKALANCPTLTAEGMIWMVAMLSPNSSDLAVSAKIPDHISTRSAVIKNYRPDVELERPAFPSATTPWCCTIVQLPSLDVAALAVAWDPTVVTAPPPFATNTGYGWDTWAVTGSTAYRLIPTAVGGFVERTITGNETLNREDAATVELLSSVTTTPPTFHWLPVTSVHCESTQTEADFSMWRMVANGMTVGFRAAALTNQGTVYGVDCGRMASEYCSRLYLNNGFGVGAQAGTTIVGGASGVVRVNGKQSWIEDFRHDVIFRATDVCRDQAKRGSYTVLYPRASAHPYIPFSKNGPFMINDDDGGSNSALLVVSGANARVYYPRIDPTYGVKVVKYVGMAPSSTLVVKNVSFIEYVVNPGGGFNGLVTSAFPYDSVAMDTALGFAANLPVMYSENDNDWAGFWKKVGGFLGKVPGWLNNKARPWIKQTGGAISGLIQDSKDAASGIASHF